jgi:2-aminoadipate transaminase
MLEELLPPEAGFTRPNGGMFVWVTLPDSLSAMGLFEAASRHNVAFVPGRPFYVDGGGRNTLRLNFSNATEADIETGLKRLATAIQETGSKK